MEWRSVHHAVIDGIAARGELNNNAYGENIAELDCNYVNGGNVVGELIAWRGMELMANVGVSKANEWNKSAQ